MEDQVRSMQKIHMGCVTINSLLSPQERTQNLNDVRQGQAAILLISPEQLRSRSVTNSLETRRVGLWVLDEAHCLSKWGHDFRPDYRYIGRWLRNHHPPEERGAVLCLTATGKPDVEKDITDYFTETLDKTLEVVGGGAIIYCSRRKATEDVAEFLNQQGIPAERFHAGITGEEKRDIQERFVSGDLRILAATSALGMGIDRPDIRLILQSEMPGSLENYIQEAGRDQEHARCLLFYSPEDTEEQFSLNARGRSRNDNETVLRALRRLEDRNSRMLSSFNYAKARACFLSREIRQGVEVYQVNPAFSSVIGRVKFMERYGLSVHQAAALVLARRFLGCSEGIPRLRVAPLGNGVRVAFSVSLFRDLRPVVITFIQPL